LHLVLVHPEIHSNTGNIARTSVVIGADLHLVKPLGFSLEDRYLRRAGLDYWPQVRLHLHESIDELLPMQEEYWLFSAHGRPYGEVQFGADPWLFFGRESTGLEPEILQAHRERVVRIPMRPGVRSLNLGNAVAIAAYEALRQHGYPGLQLDGR
jgi:tRNA (cytidine/uridine-2'-O-)-methyltransferase